MVDRFVGIMLLMLGSLGALCIAEDYRQVHEVLGVSAVFVAGMLMTMSGFHRMSVDPVMARAMTAGVLVGLLAGAAAGSVVNGLALGLAAGLLVGFTMTRSRQRPSNDDPTGPPS